MRLRGTGGEQVPAGQRQDGSRHGTSIAPDAQRIDRACWGARRVGARKRFGRRHAEHRPRRLGVHGDFRHSEDHIRSCGRSYPPRTGFAGTDVGSPDRGQAGHRQGAVGPIYLIPPAAARAGQPFVRVNCRGSWAAKKRATGPPVCGTLAQELNGGSMAYALCERARGGTPFLDRIGTLDHELQTRSSSWLLQNASAADVRLLATRDPAEALASCLAAAGLPVVEIVVPLAAPAPAPDIRWSSISSSCTSSATAYRRAACDTEAMVQLWQYDWPGNVRELEASSSVSSCSAAPA